MSKNQAPLQEHFCEIPQAQFVAHTPQHHEAHHIGGVLQMVEACAGPLIKLPLTGMTPKASVAERSAYSSFTRSSRLTVWTPHRPPLLNANVYTPSLSKAN